MDLKKYPLVSERQKKCDETQENGQLAQHSLAVHKDSEEIIQRNE
jgi:hypothetical protein